MMWMLIGLALASQDLDADGWTAQDGDCDDHDALVWPGAAELCDGVDNRCAGALDAFESDLDGDGWMACEGDCDDQDPDTHPSAAEAVDGEDNDCDDLIDEETEAWDGDGDGWAPQDGDCDDERGSIHPGADDPGGDDADGEDNDCDGLTDEGTSDRDLDGDGFTKREGDCNDRNDRVHPSAEELRDGLDNDCDGKAELVEGCAAQQASLLLLLPGLLGWRRQRASRQTPTKPT